MGNLRVENEDVTGSVTKNDKNIRYRRMINDNGAITWPRVVFWILLAQLHHS